MNGTRTLIQGDQDLNHDQEREKKLEGEEEREESLKSPILESRDEIVGEFWHESHPLNPGCKVTDVGQ